MSLFGNVQPVIYVVDDEQDNVDFMTRALGGLYDVSGFSDPQLALESAEKQPPVGLVVDYRMPGMSGVDLVRNIRQRGLITGVVMLTAFPDLDDVVHAQQTKLVYRIMAKPCSVADLQTSVELAIAEVLYKGALDAYSRLLRSR